MAPNASQRRRQNPAATSTPGLRALPCSPAIHPPFPGDTLDQSPSATVVAPPPLPSQTTTRSPSHWTRSSPPAWPKLPHRPLPQRPQMAAAARQSVSEPMNSPTVPIAARRRARPTLAWPAPLPPPPPPPVDPAYAGDRGPCRRATTAVDAVPLSEPAGSSRGVARSPDRRLVAVAVLRRRRSVAAVRFAQHESPSSQHFQ